LAELLPPLKPNPIKERLSVLYIEKGPLDVLDGAFVIVDKTGVRTHVPVGGIACLMLEPGTRVSHAACALAGRAETLLVWIGEAREYDPEKWHASDVPNRCLSAATSCLYGVAEAAVLAAGYAPAVGFIHTGTALSFVYDVADIYKFETVVPIAFRVAARGPGNPEQQVRLGCRDIFRETRLLDRIIPGIEEMLAAASERPPDAPEDAVQPAIPNPETLGDVGHRS